MPIGHRLEPDIDPRSIPRGWVRLKTGEWVRRGCRIYLEGRWQTCCLIGEPFEATRHHTDRYTYIRRAKR